MFILRIPNVRNLIASLGGFQRCYGPAEYPDPEDLDAFPGKSKRNRFVIDTKDNTLRGWDEEKKGWIEVNAGPNFKMNT